MVRGSRLHSSKPFSDFKNDRPRHLFLFKRLENEFRCFLIKRQHDFYVSANQNLHSGTSNISEPLSQTTYCWNRVRRHQCDVLTRTSHFTVVSLIRSTPIKGECVIIDESLLRGRIELLSVVHVGEGHTSLLHLWTYSPVVQTVS